MTEFSRALPASETPIPVATLKRRVVSICFFGAVAVAFIGWLFAISWLTVVFANWLLS
jgi:hypothetical protein